MEHEVAETMELSADRNTVAARSVVAVIGMAALWYSVFNRLLYPFMYSTRHVGEESIWITYALYAAVFAAGVLIFLFARKRLLEPLLANYLASASFGPIGSFGILLPALAPSGTVPGLLAVGAGAILVAAYICMHLVYWMTSARNNGALEASLSIALALALFFAGNMVFSLLGTHSIAPVALCPLLSGAMIVLAGMQGRRPVTFDSDSRASGADSGSAQQAALQAADTLPHESAELAQPHHLATSIASVPVHAQGKAEVFPLVGSTVDAADAALAALVKDHDLSSREAEIAALAYRNYSAKRIGQELFIADSTVYTHLKRIYRKLNVHSKRELIERIDAQAEQLR